MSSYYSLRKGILSAKKGWSSLLIAIVWLLSPGSLSACDTSGFVVNSYTDNGDGTFTVDLTIMVAGDFTTDCGSTWGFFWNTDVPIVSVSPPSLTSNNGTTLNAMIAGTMVTWGDPLGSFPTIPFVDAEPGSLTNDEMFNVTIVLGSQGVAWNGGGQEANTCPNNGCAANPPNYAQPFPCFEPSIEPGLIFPICPGIPTEISVIPNVYTDNIVWQPGNLMGESVIVAPTETTEYTVTASNACAEFEITIIVEVMPLPTIEAIQEDIEACEGFPVIMEVTPMYEDIVTWDPGGGVGNVFSQNPTTSPAIYTATASNVCGDESVMIVVNLIPSPSVEITNDVETICDGESIELESTPMNADVVEWLPGNISGASITVSPTATTEYIVLASSNCGVAFDTVTVMIAGRDTTQVLLGACEGETVLFNNIPLAAGTMSTFTLENIVGCDSVVIVTVEEIPAVEVPLELSACEGTTIVYENTTLSPGDVEEFTFTAANGCDSVVTVTVLELTNYAMPLQLSACNGSTVMYENTALSPGDVEDFPFTAINGCDSVVTVTVVGYPTYDIPVLLQTCTGTTIPYNGQNLAPGSVTVFDLTTINGCDSTVTVTVEELSNFATAIELETCTGTTATYNNTQLMPGTVTDFNFVTALGCDSIVTVTVNEVAIIEEEVALSACAGQSAMFNNTAVPAGTTMDFNFTTAQGCDSVVTVTVEELVIYTLPLTLEACTGSSIIYNGMELFANTTTDVTLVSSDGCDSIMTVTVEEVTDVTAALTLPACAGETVNFNSQQLAAGSVTDFTFVSSLGCDSILTVTVEEYPTYAYPLSLQACTGSTATFNGVDLPPGTTLNFNLMTVNGCDSVIAVTVTEVETIYEELEFETCVNTFITYNNQQLAPGTVMDFTFTSAAGCDSVVTVTVNESDMLGGTTELFACTGSTATFNGQALAPGTVTDFNLVTAAGCDSLVTVTVTELETYAIPVNLQACTGSTVTYNGQELDPGTVTDFNLTTVDGCDSVITVTVDEVAVLTGSLEFSACTGSTVSFNGQQLMAGSVTDFNFTSSQGCDSILTVTVIELFPQTGVDQLAACTGESVAYHGQQLLAGTVSDVVLQAANGCDSVVTVTVNELNATTNQISLQGCEGETLFYNGTEITPGTSQDFILTNAIGCDSILTVSALDPIPFVESFETIEVCEGESALIFGQLISAAGTYSETYVGMNGCDSIANIILDVASDVVVGFQDNISIGLGETVILYPLTPIGSTLTYNWTPDSTLSCFDCPTPLASPLNTTTYYLTIADEKGCEASADVLVAVRKERGVYIPNSFSPNGDGINDVFMVFSDPGVVSNISAFKVFSRWGEGVFEISDFQPNDPTMGWDGTHRGEVLDPAVFAYFVEVEFIDGVKQLFKGEVTLVK